MPPAGRLFIDFLLDRSLGSALFLGVMDTGCVSVEETYPLSSQAEEFQYVILLLHICNAILFSSHSYSYSF